MILERATELPDNEFADLKSRFYRFAITEGIWFTLAEPFMLKVRRAEKALGRNKRESRRTAWLKAERTFTPQTLKAYRALDDVVAAEPLPPLTGSQGAAWRLSIKAISIAVRQTPEMTHRAERLRTDIDGRIARGQVQRDIGHLDRADFYDAAKAFTNGKQTCDEQLSQIVRDLRGIEPDEDDHQLKNELSLITTTICEDRTAMIEALCTNWSAASVAK